MSIFGKLNSQIGNATAKRSYRIPLASAGATLSIALVAFYLPAISELSTAPIGQVGVDKRESKNKQPKKTKQKEGARGVENSSRRHSEPPFGILVMSTDMDCRIAIDGQFVDFLDEAQIKELRADAGQYRVKATSLDGRYLWTKTFQVARSQRVTVAIGLKNKIEQKRGPELKRKDRRR